MLNKMLYVKYPARVNPLPDEAENSRHSAVLLKKINNKSVVHFSAEIHKLKHTQVIALSRELSIL